MLQVQRACLVAFAALATLAASLAHAQSAPAPDGSPAAGTATLREIRADGLKSIPQPVVVALSGLQSGAVAGRDDLQAAADKLVASGLFAHVKYNFQTRVDGLVVTFHVDEAQRIPAYFDNIPWFTDGELNDAIRKKISYYDGTLPAAGGVVEDASTAVSEFLATHGLQAAVEHQSIGNPNGDGNVQDFHIEGGALKISHLEFSDPALNSSKEIQQSLSELKGKPYSRLAIDFFLTEQVRPVYLKQGYLRAKLGPPEIRLTGNPNQKLPEQIPVFVPITPGAVYHWKGAEWSGNSTLSTITLNNELGLKAGDIADGMQVEGGFEKVREEYAHVGYLDAKVDAAPAYDETAHTISYKVQVEEGKPYKFGALTITGLSVAAEKHLREAWPFPQGGELFDKAVFEEFVTKLQSEPKDIFGNLPVHYDKVGHWLNRDEEQNKVDVLLDFQ
jgi:outer membrane protein insertion porin family